MARREQLLRLAPAVESAARQPHARKQPARCWPTLEEQPQEEEREPAQTCGDPFHGLTTRFPKIEHPLEGGKSVHSVHSCAEHLKTFPRGYSLRRLSENGAQLCTLCTLFSAVAVFPVLQSNWANRQNEQLCTVWNPSGVKTGKMSPLREAGGIGLFWF